MTVCIPTEDQNGLEAAVSGHFGRAPYFALVDSESRQVRFVENRDPSHESGRCIGAALAARNHPEAVLTAGMGRGAYDLLHGRGARIYRTAPGTVAAALDAFAAGQSEELISADAAGHDHGPGHHAGAGRTHAAGSGRAHGPGRGAGRGRDGDCCGEGHRGGGGW